jgi:hypothetical protein
MHGKDPFAMNWLEVRILNRLADRGHAVALHDMKENLVPGKTETVVNTIYHLRDEGLINIFEPEMGGHLVEITAIGKAVLRDVMVHSRNRCD